jgi:ATP-dependent protease Clp ATPase subunit
MSYRTYDGSLMRTCDFCEATEEQVRFLVESEHGRFHICSGCVARCSELLLEAMDGKEEEEGQAAD